MSQATDYIIQRYKDVTVVDFQNASVLDATVIDAMGHNLSDMIAREDHRKVVLDFSNVRFMSSQALGVMLKIKRVIDQVKGTIVIVGIRPDLHRVFQITNLHKLFLFADELDGALAKFGIEMPR